MPDILEEFEKIVEEKLKQNNITKKKNICIYISIMDLVCTKDNANKLMFLDINLRDNELENLIQDARNNLLFTDVIKHKKAHINDIIKRVDSIIENIENNFLIEHIHQQIRRIYKEQCACVDLLNKDRSLRQIKVIKEQAVKNDDKTESINDLTPLSPGKIKSNEVYGNLKKTFLMADFDIAYQKEKAEGEKYLNFNEVQ